MSTLLCFRVRAVTQINQTVKICGNIPELGSWNPKNALTLTTNENVYPMWINQNYLNLQSVDHYVHLEFKCIIVSGENQYWENTPNRIMKLDCIKLIIFCTFGVADVSIVPLKKYSTDSLNLDENEVGIFILILKANVRKVHLGGQLNPFESDFNSSSDPESDFQSLLRSRESQGLDESTVYQIEYEHQKAEQLKAINNSLREIEIPKLEMVSYSSGSDIVKKFPITNWGEQIKKQFLEEKDIYSNSRKSSRKSSMFSETMIKTVSSNNLLNFYEHHQLTKLYRKENTHKLIVISFFARQQQKQQPTGQDVLSPSQFFNEQQKNQLTRIVKKLAKNPKNTVIVIGCDQPLELDNMFGKFYSTYLIANKGRYVCQAQKNNEFEDLKDVFKEIWDKVNEMIRSLSDNYDYITFTYNSDCVEIDCSLIINEVQILIKPKQIKQCVLQEICDTIVAYVGLNTFIQVDQNQNQVLVQIVYQDIGILIQTIVSHEIQTKGPIQFQLQVVYNASHDDDLFQCLEEINKHKHLRRKRAFSTILKSIYLVPVSKDSRFSNIRCNSQFEMIKLLDKMTSEVSVEQMVEDQQELMYY